MAKKDPYKTHRFWLEIDDIAQVGFREVTIPDSSQDPVEYREGNEDPWVRKLPGGLVKAGNVTLKWGITDFSTYKDLFEWRKQIENGDVEKGRRKNMAIVLQDDMGNDQVRWELTNVWPTKYDASDLNATTSEVAIETLEIACERIVRTK